ncbi:hypothetical protein Dsin_011555 [Dipteronia sinensis]|uniref:HAT C-terminal dimerisation domain-containing protein n=1 Tax=Dipteronia sinensis TaxID=43782 RepID=A0AAE0EFG4_9ROSI|nr:hypothetical protein Dsin_011555 [Dipteronia sinensis]
MEFAYKKVYGIDSLEIDNVQNKLLSLFNEYMLTSISTKESTSTSLPSSSGGGDTITDTGGDIFATDIIQMYLDEPKLEMSSNLDVLDYWKVNTVRHPVSEALEVDDVTEDILKLTLENSPGL